jgi:hypothetical protein
MKRRRAVAAGAFVLLAVAGCSRGASPPPRTPATTSPAGTGDTGAPTAPGFVGSSGPVAPSDLDNIVPTGSATP